LLEDIAVAQATLFFVKESSILSITRISFSFTTISGHKLNVKIERKSKRNFLPRKNVNKISQKQVIPHFSIRREIPANVKHRDQTQPDTALVQFLRSLST